MSAADILISIVISFIKRLLIPILPTSIPFFSYENFLATLDSLKVNLVYSLSGISLFFPVDLLLNIILAIIFAEIALFTFRIGKFVINLFRGSGA